MYDIQSALTHTENPGQTPIAREFPLDLISHHQMQHSRSHTAANNQHNPNK